MVEPRRAIWVFLSSLAAVACSAGNDSSGSSTDPVYGQGPGGESSCNAGETVSCYCPDGTQSTQMCDESGTQFTACACPSSTAGGAGGQFSGAAGTAVSPGTGGLPAGTGGVPVGSGGTPTGTGGVATTGTGGVPSSAGGAPPAGTGGVPPASTGGMAGMPSGTGGEPPAGTGGATPAPGGKADPVIPPVTADCPQFVNSTITFMGLGGIQIVAGAAPPSPTAPMVFYWHGTGSTAGEFAFMASAVRDGVVAEGGVLVSFQNTTGGDLSSGTNIFGESDYALTDQLVACAVRDHNIDPRRIFTTGCSAGGLFADAMAARRSSYIAAAASNSGGWVVPQQFDSAYTPPLMTVHGAPGVDVVGVDFSNTSATADQAFKARGGFAIDCNTGGNHCGGGGLAPDIWQFFEAHPYGVDPEPWAGGLPAGFSSQCTIQ